MELVRQEMTQQLLHDAASSLVRNQSSTQMGQVYLREWFLS